MKVSVENKPVPCSDGEMMGPPVLVVHAPHSAEDVLASHMDTVIPTGEKVKPRELIELALRIINFCMTVEQVVDE